MIDQESRSDDRKARASSGSPAVSRRSPRPLVGGGRAAACSLLVILLWSWGCSPGDPSDESRPIADAPHPAAEIVGPGVVSTELPEFGLTVSPDGSEAYFNRASADRSTLEILVARSVEGRWRTAEPVPFSGQYRDLDPFITVDGGRLLFASERPKEAGSQPADFDLWSVRRDGAGWSRPERLAEEINTAANQFFVSVSRSGVVYYDEADDDGRRVKRAVPDGTGGYAVETLSGGVLPSDASNPLVSPDETFLIFAAPSMQGDTDLFVALRDGESWGEPVALPEPVRSAFAEFAPGLWPDGATLFFTSERPGVVRAVDEGRPPGDVYRFPLAALPIGAAVD
jgi:hypothetical protein